MAHIFTSRGKFGDRDRPKERACEKGGRVWNNAAASRGNLRIAESHQELGRSKEGVFLRAFRREDSANILISDS